MCLCMHARSCILGWCFSLSCVALALWCQTPGALKIDNSISRGRDPAPHAGGPDGASEEFGTAPLRLSKDLGGREKAGLGSWGPSCLLP